MFPCPVNILIIQLFSDYICKNAEYGEGREGDTANRRCAQGLEGNKTAVCENREWKVVEDTCIVSKIKELLTVSEVINHSAPNAIIFLVYSCTTPIFF